MNVIVNVAGVSKTYGGIHHVLDGCSIEVQKGKRIGMVGPNGAGKSTLFRLIAGREEPDAGAIWRQRIADRVVIGHDDIHTKFGCPGDLFVA